MDFIARYAIFALIVALAICALIALNSED